MLAIASAPADLRACVQSAGPSPIEALAAAKAQLDALLRSAQTGRVTRHEPRRMQQTEYTAEQLAEFKVRSQGLGRNSGVVSTVQW